MTIENITSSLHEYRVSSDDHDTHAETATDVVRIEFRSSHIFNYVF